MNLRECYAAMNSDFEDVFSRLMREASIAKFLRKFLEDTTYQNMMKAIEEKNYKDVFATSHNLKGVSANLGLTALSKSSSEICELCRNGEPAEDLTPYVEQVRHDYQLIVDAVAQLED